MDPEETYELSYILDYDFDDPITDTELFCILSIRVQDFTSQKKKEYAAAITSEMVEDYIGKGFLLTESFPADKKHQLVRELLVDTRLRTENHFWDVDYGSGKKEDSMYFIATTGASGSKSVSLRIAKYNTSRYYLLTVDAKNPDVLAEMSEYFSQPFRILPRQKLVEDFLSGRDLTQRTLEILWQFAKNTPYPQASGDLLKVFAKALTVPNKDVLEEITGQLWFDMQYEKSIYALSLKTELEIFLQDANLTALVSNDDTDQVKEILEAIRQNPKPLG